MDGSAEKPAQLLGFRHVQYTLLFTAMLVTYAQRISFYVGVIAMLSNKPLKGVDTYPDWEPMKNKMISSFFWGYVPTQVVAGVLAKNLGAKWFLGVTTLMGCIFFMLIPIFAKFGYGGVFFCRIVQGFTQSFLYPCVHTLLSKWTPIGDRAKVSGFVYAGIPLGTLLSMPITGMFSKYENIGWPMAFYTIGAVGVVWFVIWVFLAAESPAHHAAISEIERKYIEVGACSEAEQKKMKTPWKSIFTSMPFLAILVVQSGENWGYWFLVAEIPSFLNKILHFDIAENSFLSALPYLVFWILSYVMGPIADTLIQKGVTSRTTSRKIFNSIAMFVPVVCLAGVCFVTDRAITIVLLALSVGSTAGVFSGYYVNHIDLSPNHAGSLIGITTMSGSVFSLLSPMSLDLINHLTDYTEEDRGLWILIFYTTAAVYLVTGLFYDIFASAEVQPWNSPKDD